MRTRWLLYRFDAARFAELALALRAADSPEQFTELAGDDTDARSLADALHEADFTPEQARSAFARAACCFGDPVPLGANFARVLEGAARHRDAADAADALRELLLGGRGLPDWLSPSPALRGFLTPDETVRLRVDFTGFSRARRGRRRRRGGLLGRVRSFVSQLFDQAPPEHEILALLRALLDDAVVHGYGIAATDA